MRLTPDDWGSYWRRCEYCGRQYHLSDGYCDCLEEITCNECGGDEVEAWRGRTVRCRKCGHVQEVPSATMRGVI